MVLRFLCSHVGDLAMRMDEHAADAEQKVNE